MVIRWLNPYGADYHYVVKLPNGQLWSTESVDKAIDAVAAFGGSSESIAFERKEGY